MTAPKIAPAIISSKIIQVKINAIKEGTDIITAIIVPRRIISFFVRLIEGLSSDDRSVLKKIEKLNISSHLLAKVRYFLLTLNREFL